MAEFASKGVAGAGLGTGIAGLSLGVLNSLGGMGGLLLGARPFAAGMAMNGGCCSEDHCVNRYELGLIQENSTLKSDIALRDANVYQDQKMLEIFRSADRRRRLTVSTLMLWDSATSCTERRRHSHWISTSSSSSGS